MGVFDDKKFEQLDWMTQITETIESPLNELLSRLPERYEIDNNAFLSIFNSSSYNTSATISQVVDIILSVERQKGAPLLTYDQKRLIYACFKWEVPEEIEIDLEKQTIKADGIISVVKIKNTFSDEELAPMMGQESIGDLRDLMYSKNISRMNEILELLGNCEDTLRNRSSRKKIVRMQNRLREIFKNNEWRIRDSTLADKLAVWIKQYVEHGNLAAFTNFCKVKVMTHNNMPIYSIEEEK